MIFLTLKIFFSFKGKAYIIVDGKRDAAIDTLAHVLAKTDNILMGRRIRIEIYQVSYTTNQSYKTLHFSHEEMIVVRTLTLAARTVLEDGGEILYNFIFLMNTVFSNLSFESYFL